MTSYGYRSRLEGMMILAMTSARALQSPAIRLDELYGVSDLHLSATPRVDPLFVL